MKRWLIVLAVLMVIAVAAMASALLLIPPRVRGDIATTLAAQLGQDVQVDSLNWRLWPTLQLSGRQIRVGSSAGADTPPVLTIESFVLDTDLRSILAKPRRIHSVRVERLRAHIAREPREEPAAGRGETAPGPVESGSRGQRASGADPAATHGSRSPGHSDTPVVVSEVVVQNAVLEIGSTRADRQPQVYEIEQLRLGSVALDRPVSFQASLVNPRPPGHVQASGKFGPWNKADAADTPIEGTYRFENADLGTFKGIEGMLVSDGTFGGSIGRVTAKGSATIQDFILSVGQVVPLAVAFETEVGERGADLQLRTVDIEFFQSLLVAAGEVVKPKGAPGRTVSLDVASRQARVEDVVRFALKGKDAPLSGDLDLKTALLIPPGEEPVIERLQLDGEFRMRRARFANLDVQKTLARLSQFTVRESEGQRGASVVSDLRGRFTLRDAVLSFSGLTFSVPGTTVQLVGSYGLADEQMRFRGRLLLAKAPSQMAPDRLSKWLELADPIFRRGEAGTTVPISISGTRAKPTFRIDAAALKDDWRKILETIPR
jgi:hypothetical protein